MRRYELTYKLNPNLEKILSPVIVLFPDGSRQDYKDGSDLVSAVFENKYIISTIQAVKDAVQIELDESSTSSTGWIGEEQTFF